MGSLVEASGFHPGRTARDHLRTVAVAAGLATEAPERALAEVDLTSSADRRVGTFSLGMRQRLGLATALLGDPRVLVLDEPANGLDPQGIIWLRRYLRELADRGRTVFVSSHVLAEIEQIADHILMIAAGRLVRAATLAELRAETGVATRVRSPEAPRMHELLVAAGHEARRSGADELVVTATPEDVGEIAAQHRIVLHRLSETESLEEAFLRLTEGSE